MRLTPVQQLANSIVEAAGTAADEPTPLPQAGAVAASAPVGAAARIKPLQVLNITLDPPDLGSVSIKMRLTGQKLDLNIEVAQKDTVPLLGKEGDSLSNALQSSGYTVDSLTIKAASGAAVGSQHHHDPSRGPRPVTGPSSGPRPAILLPILGWVRTIGSRARRGWRPQSARLRPGPGRRHG